MRGGSIPQLSRPHFIGGCFKGGSVYVIKTTSSFFSKEMCVVAQEGRSKLSKKKKSLSFFSPFFLSKISCFICLGCTPRHVSVQGELCRTMGSPFGFSDFVSHFAKELGYKRTPIMYQKVRCSEKGFNISKSTSVHIPPFALSTTERFNHSFKSKFISLPFVPPFSHY